MKRLAVFVIAGVLALPACGGNTETLSVKASFADIADLAPRAPVMMDDVRVGEVTGIELYDNRALVTMNVEKSARVPADVVARVRRTSLLGERIIDLQHADSVPDDAPLLKDGQTIRQTVVRSDLEDLVREGTEVLNPISASEIATLVDEGYKGFGQSGPELRSLLRSFGKITQAFAGETDTIQSVISSLNELNTTIAKKASAHALAVRNSERGLRMLREETGRLKAAIVALNRLAVGGASLMRAHFGEMSRFWGQMRTILGAVEAERDALVQFLEWNLRHNRNTQMVEYQEFNQILQDFVICGFNENKNEPARTCEPNKG